MTESALEAEFLALIRSLGGEDKKRVERLLAGVLAGRITLTSEEVVGLRAGDVMALADALPPDAIGDWAGQKSLS